jgi:hypothetical protein
VPELSDIAMNVRLTYALVTNTRKLTYDPYVGTPGQDVGHRLEYDFPLGGPPLEGPDVCWWKQHSAGDLALLLAFLTLMALGTAGLRPLLRSRSAVAG